MNQQVLEFRLSVYSNIHCWGCCKVEWMSWTRLLSLIFITQSLKDDFVHHPEGTSDSHPLMGNKHDLGTLKKSSMSIVNNCQLLRSWFCDVTVHAQSSENSHNKNAFQKDTYHLPAHSASWGVVTFDPGWWGVVTFDPGWWGGAVTFDPDWGGRCRDLWPWLGGCDLWSWLRGGVATFDPGQGGGVVTFHPGQGGRRWLIFGPPPKYYRMTDTCENITFAHFDTWAVKISLWRHCMRCLTIQETV